MTLDVSRALRPNAKVVVDERGLPVEMEVRIALVEQVEQSVEHSDEMLAERLERQVPLAIPVGVRNQGDPH